MAGLDSEPHAYTKCIPINKVFHNLVMASKCTLCAYATDHRQDLTAHEKRHNLAVYYTCYECHQIFTGPKATIKRHFTELHEDIV